VQLRIEAPDSERYQAALRHVGRGARRTVRLAGATLLCLSAISLVDGASTAPGTTALRVIFVVLGLGCLLLGALLAFAPIRYTANLSSLAIQPAAFELTDDYIRQTSPLYASQTAWEAFIRLEEIPGQLLLFVAKRQFISVPTTALTDGQLAELRRFVADRNARLAGGGPAPATRPASG
jgi:hypothetical protein